MWQATKFMFFFLFKFTNHQYEKQEWRHKMGIYIIKNIILLFPMIQYLQFTTLEITHTHAQFDLWNWNVLQKSAKHSGRLQTNLNFIPHEQAVSAGGKLKSSDSFTKERIFRLLCFCLDVNKVWLGGCWRGHTRLEKDGETHVLSVCVAWCNLRWDLLPPEWLSGANNRWDKSRSSWNETKRAQEQTC